MSRSMLFPLVAAVILAVTACDGEQTRPAQRRHVVEISGFGFHPASLAVGAGDTVVWVNRDAVPHTATGAGGEWDSGSIAAGDSWTFTISEMESGAYICSFHPTMIGRLEIQ